MGLSTKHMKNSFDISRADAKATGVKLLLTIGLLIGVLSTSYAQKAELITFDVTKSAFAIAEKHQVITIVTDANDFEVVHIATAEFQKDIERVTGVMPRIKNQIEDEYIIIVGSIEGSKWIRDLVKTKKIDVGQIEGEWERYMIQVVADPFPGVKQALIICGSDRRGTAYAMFELSKQMGVSPWYWWADIPPQKHEEVHFSQSRIISKPPSVQYRGIFINDELWGLGPWAEKIFEPEVGALGPRTYQKIFELMLRLKANYIWPSMNYKKGFYQVAGNKEMADRYAIIMGTSHIESLHFNTLLEWDKEQSGPWQYDINRDKIYQTWDKRARETAGYENIYTMGMRGSLDKGMEGGLELERQINLLEEIFKDQREILSRHHEKIPERIPQVFTPYKEVLKLYQEGIQIPDDMIIVWPDDNYGYLRQVNSGKEKMRSGGSGIYYHLNYIGRPQSYVWLSSTNPMLIWKELNKAFGSGVNKLWIFNVGDIKPHEQQIDYCLNLAWSFPRDDPEAPAQRVKKWYVETLGEELGDEAYRIMQKYYKLAFERKPEFMGWDRLEPTTPVINTEYSYHNYNELHNRLVAYKRLAGKAEDLYSRIPETERASYFQLVYYPVIGSYHVNQKILYAQINRIYARQGRSLTNHFAKKAKTAFNSIQLLTDQYCSLEDNKWKEIITWRSFGFSNMPPVDSIFLPGEAEMGIDYEGNNVGDPARAIHSLPVFNALFPAEYHFEVFNKGTVPFHWTATPDKDWIKLDQSAGDCLFQEKITVSIDWEQVPAGSHLGNIRISGAAISYTLSVQVFNPSHIDPESLIGLFLEKNGSIGIPAENYHKKHNRGEYHWSILDNIGQTGKAVTIFPDTLERIDHEWGLEEKAPSLEFEFYSFSSGWCDILSYTLPTHAMNQFRGCLYGISVDDQPPRIIDFSTRERSEQWKQNVQRNAAIGQSKHFISTPGKHTLKVWLIDTDVVFDKFIIDFGGLKRSYL